MNSPVDEQTLKTIVKIANVIYHSQFVLTIVGICFTIPHLIVSTRKSMRSFSISSLVIVIALCDLIVLSFLTFDRIYEYTNPYNTCNNGLTFFFHASNVVSDASKETFTRCSFWLGVSLALIRLIIIKVSVEVNLKLVYRVSFASIVLILAINFLVTANYYLRIQISRTATWRPPEMCDDYPANYTEPIYAAYIPNYDDDDFGPFEVYEVAKGSSQVTVAVIYPILAVFLYLEIRTFTSRRINEQVSSDRVRTSRMVLLMTICYVVTSAPEGIVIFLELVVDPTSVSAFFLTQTHVYFPALFAAKTTAHCLICFSSSTEYRKTVRSLMGIKGKKDRR